MVPIPNLGMESKLPDTRNLKLESPNPQPQTPILEPKIPKTKTNPQHSNCKTFKKQILSRDQDFQNSYFAEM